MTGGCKGGIAVEGRVLHGGTGRPAGRTRRAGSGRKRPRPTILGHQHLTVIRRCHERFVMLT